MFYSRRRQVTKRKFNILGSPNVLQNVQMHKNTSKGEEIKKNKERNGIDEQNNNMDTEINRIENYRADTGNNNTDCENNRTDSENNKVDMENNRVENNRTGTVNNNIDNKRTDTENRKTDRTRSQTQMFSSEKTKVQQSLSGRKRSNANSHSHGQDSVIQEPNGNDDVRVTDTVPSESYKVSGHVEITPEKQLKVGQADNTQTPGDVSVSFLASTPKPGRPQLSRRRPISPVRESLEVSNNSNQVTVKPQAKQTGVRSSRKELPRQHSPQKSPWKRPAGSSIDEMIASSNKSRLESKRKHLDLNKNNSTNNESTTAERSVSALTSKSSLTGSSRRQKVSVPIRDISVTETRKSVIDCSVSQTEGVKYQIRSRSRTGRNTHQTSVIDTDKTSVRSVGGSGRGSDLDEDVTSDENTMTRRIEGNRLTLLGECRKTAVNKRLQALGGKKSSKKRETGRNVSRGRVSEDTSSEGSDLTIRNKSRRLTLSSQRRKSVVNRTLQTLQRQQDSDINRPDQTLVMWEGEGQKRTRTDMMDLDVILNTVTETLEARLDVYDTDEEQSAVHLLEKYLTQDITHMICGVQSVTDLQSKIKKCGQSIKQKQKSLMSLQKERVKMEEKCQPAKKRQEKNEKIETINQFVTDLGRVVDMC